MRAALKAAATAARVRLALLGERWRVGSLAGTAVWDRERGTWTVHPDRRAQPGEHEVILLTREVPR